MRVGGIGQDVTFSVSVLLKDEPRAIHEGSLGDVLLKSSLFQIAYGEDVEHTRQGSHQRSGAIRKKEVRGEVKQALWTPGLTEFKEAFGCTRPVKRGRSRCGNGCVVRMVIQCAFSAEGDHNVGTKAPYALDEEAAQLMKSVEFKLGVTIGELLVRGDRKDIAGIDELLPPQRRPGHAVFSTTAMGRGLTISEADYARLDARLGGKGKRPSKSEALVVGMSDDTEKS